MDPNWNPAIEAQACDRAYRIGQTKDVTITRMVQTRKNGKDSTIEQVIRLIQAKKQQCADALFPKPPAKEILELLIPPTISTDAF